MLSNRRVGSICGCSLKFALLLVLLVYLAFVMIHKTGTNSTVYVGDPDETMIQWDWLLSNNGNNDQDDCKFENYILGQPVEQTDPCLVSMFKNNLLHPPPPPEEQNPDKLHADYEMSGNREKLQWIEKLIIENPSEDMKDKPGFFIECGANDGTFISPTISLEKKYHWTGLLIEANPIPFQSLLSKKRNCWAVNAAACVTQHPEQITFYTNPKNTGISGMNARENKGVKVNITVPCIPIYTMLLALNVDTVDFLSLDVEGAELAILETLPFDKIKFKVLSIEYILIPGKQQALKNFLEPKGYKFVKEITDRWTKDCLYVHESLYELASTIKI